MQINNACQSCLKSVVGQENGKSGCFVCWLVHETEKLCEKVSPNQNQTSGENMTNIKENSKNPKHPLLIFELCGSFSSFSVAIVLGKYAILLIVDYTIIYSSKPMLNGILYITSQIGCTAICV